ncbi:MAG: conjugative transposon protein TraM, partial [Flavisolibacter sp.]|nr:conjugative transposon protein TraM [Flavisolibacter sp.]
MKTKMHAPQFLRKRKFLIVLPPLVLPFITLLFWALGGGKGNEAEAYESTAKGGLNAALPDAQLKEDKTLDKLSYYEKAASDSARLQELMKTDPYYLQHQSAKKEGLFSGRDSMLSSINDKRNIPGNAGLNTSPYNPYPPTDPNEAKVYKKLEDLNAVLHNTNMQPGKAPAHPEVSSRKGNTISSADMDRLEQMMELTKRGTSGEDPEIKQLNG